MQRIEFSKSFVVTDAAIWSKGHIHVNILRTKIQYAMKTTVSWDFDNDDRFKLEVNVRQLFETASGQYFRKTERPSLSRIVTEKQAKTS